MGNGQIMKGRLISGGLLGEEPVKLTLKQQAQSRAAQAPKEVNPEGWGQFTKRNLGAVAEGALGYPQHVAETFLPNPNRNIPKDSEYYKEIPTPKEILLNVLNQGESFGPPKHLGESALRFGIPQAALTAATGGFSSLPAFGRSLMSGAGALLGSKAGEEIGGPIAKKVHGNEEAGRIIGGWLGAAIGVGGAQMATNRIAKFAAPKIRNKNLEEFEVKRKERLQELDKEHIPILQSGKKGEVAQSQKLQKEIDIFNDIKQATKKRLDEEHHANTRKIELEDKIALEELHNFKNQSKQQALEKKNQSREQLKAERTQREQLIEQLEEGRIPLYAEAKQNVGDIKGKTSEMQAALDSIDETITSGVKSSARREVYEIAEQLRKAIKTGKIPLNKAVAFKKNLNTAIYDTSLNEVVRDHFQTLRNSLSKHIEKVGEKNPKHGQPFSKAEAMHKQYKQLIDKENGDYFKRQQSEAAHEINENYRHEVSEINTEFADNKRKIDSGIRKKDLDFKYKQAKEELNNQQFPKEKFTISQDEIKRLQNNLDVTQKEFHDARKFIKKDTFDAFVKREAKNNEAASVINQIKGEINNWGLAGVGLTTLGGDPVMRGLYAVGGKLVTQLYREAKLTRMIMKEHPEISRAYWKVISQATKKNMPHVIQALNHIGNKIEAYAQEEKKEAPKGKITAGGLR